mmetsp:Transcript_101482/g.166790  ORF Transcript_101482/g.166790 Transcript_101482/m.166790 type:complete len:207 (-) Transcript_101482:86-706(-)
MWFGAPQPVSKIRKWGCFADYRGMMEAQGPLTKDDLILGRHVTHRVLHLQDDVQRSLLDFARTVQLWEAFAVHVQRSDRQEDAPANFYMSPAEAADAAVREVKEIKAQRVFLASDDAIFLNAMSESIADRGVPCVTWGSRLSQRPGRHSHHGGSTSGLEKALDALAECFLLSLCRGMLCTYSSLSMVATLWADEGFVVKHFSGCVW